jgi:serine/threonine protein phosphatase PrpC
VPTLPGWAGGFETVFDAHFSVRERPDFFTGTCHQAVVLWAAFLTRGSVLPGRSGVRSRDGEQHFIYHDGVTDGLYNSYLEEILHAPTEEPARQLVKYAVDYSGRDNTSALIIEVQCPR